MSENKFIQHLKGKDTAKSVLEIKNQVTPTTFANMPAGTSDGSVVYSDHRGNATAVLKGTDNWKLSNGTLVSATTVYGDGRDLTGSFLASGNTLWVNATYTFASPKIFTPNTKWVLKLCGHSLDSSVYNEIPFSLVVKIGNSIITKQFNVREEAFEFCKEFVIDFAESETATLHAEIGDTMNVQVLCGDATASATIYNGMSVLTALQRRVDGDAISSNTRNFDELEEDFDDLKEDYDQFVIDTGTALDGKVNIDGTSIMTAPLKFRAGSMRGAVGPYLNGVSFWKLDSQGNITNIANLTDSQFLPVTTNAIDLGRSANKWKDLYLAGKAYMSVINNGYDIAVPVTNSPQTLALKSEVDLAANSGRMITDQGVWYAKMYSATVAPSAENGTNYADFSQVDGQGNPIIVIYERQSGAWVQTETITPPAEYDGYVPITSKIWDIAEQAGQQGGRILWNHQSKEFTPYPQIISFEDIEITGNSTVVMPVNPAGGQIVNKDYVDSRSTYLTFPAGWSTSGTTKAFCDAVAADTTATKGKAYLGEVTFSDLPSGLVNAEVTVEIMDGTTAANKVIVLTMTSGNQTPYLWKYTYWNGGSNVSGWIGFQPELVSGTNIKTINGESILGSGDIQVATTGGYHPDLFAWEWSDALRNDVQWLRADTFSWQSGSVYQAAFWDLFYDMQVSTYWYGGGGPAYTKSRTPAVGDAVYLNSDLTTQIGTVDSYDDVNDEITVSGNTYSYMSNTYVTPTTETVAGYSLTVYTGHSGRKIVSVSDETNVANIYTATGVAWYYIIDIPNKRFKLPRSKHEHYGDRPVIGNDTAVHWNAGNNGQTVYMKTDKTMGSSGITELKLSIDPTQTGIISTPVEDTDQYKYLYFYVGEFTQTAIENTAGLNAELFNDKADLDFANTNMIDYVVESQEPNAGNGYTWYRKYKSGWVEQGGQISSTTASSASKTVNLPITMTDTNYFACSNTGYSGNDAPNYGNVVKSKTTTTITVGHLVNYMTNWMVSGVAA